jgi:polyribonucleotide nucleotidyltransferase
MNYFDDLLGAAHTLVKEAAGLVETTKNFRTALEVAQNVLKKDYTPEDIAENLGDVDFANEFAQELWKVMNELKAEAQKVADECEERKETLDNTLTGINKYFGEEEEELVELTSHANIGTEFNKLNDACSNYFNDVSEFVYDLQMGYIK